MKQHKRLVGIGVTVSVLIGISIVLAFGESWGMWGTASEPAPATGGNDWLSIPLEGGNEWLDIPISGGNNWAEAALISRYTLNSPSKKALFDVSQIIAFDAQAGLLTLQIVADSGNGALMDWLQEMQTNPTIQNYELIGWDDKGNVIAGWKLKDAALQSLGPLPNPSESTLAYQLSLKFNEIAMQ